MTSPLVYAVIAASYGVVSQFAFAVPVEFEAQAVAAPVTRSAAATRAYRRRPV
jgi:hypothetical protein